jgi:hypothetical protein
MRGQSTSEVGLSGKQPDDAMDEMLGLAKESSLASGEKKPADANSIA